MQSLSVSRDTLNPLLNTAVLKQRLADIERYKYRNGVEIHRWPHFLLGRMGKHLYKYKFNHGVKAFAAYIVYNDIQHWKHMQSQVFLTYQQEGELVYNTTIHTAMFFGLCAMI